MMTGQQKVRSKRRARQVMKWKRRLGGMASRLDWSEQCLADYRRREGMFFDLLWQRDHKRAAGRLGFFGRVADAWRVLRGRWVAVAA